MFRKILLVQLRQLGDIMLTTPCIRGVKEKFPDAEIHFLAHPMGKLILEGNPWIDKLHLYDPNSKWKEWQLIMELRKAGFDLVIDFMNNPRSAFYTLMTGCQSRLSVDSRRRFAYTQTIPRSQQSDYIVREKFRLLNQLGITPKQERLTLPWGQNHLGPLEQMKELEEFSQAKLRVVLSPTHRRPPRQWSKQAFAAIADRLVDEWQACVIWIWGPGEEDFVKEAQGMCKTKTLLCPQTSFRELAAFIANTDLFLGTSNGPSHVAVAADTPSLQLHGPTQAKAWCPMTTRHRAIQSPSHQSNPDESMKDIDPETVWQELSDFLPYLEKSAELRRGFGDRISWDQVKGGAR